jgi:hypothetical protein
MRFFRTPSNSSRSEEFTFTPNDLARIGTTAFGGHSPSPPGIPGLPVGELDGHVLAAMESAGFPSPGTSEWEALQRQLLEKLAAAAELGGDWAFVGALCVAMNGVATEYQDNSHYVAILDRALVVLRDDGVAYTAIPRFALNRWEQVHGCDGLRPGDWPSALEDVKVPAPGSELPVIDLENGQSRRLAQLHAGDESNVIYAERRPDGTIVAVIDGTDMADGARARWEWDGLGAQEYPSFLRLLGDRLVTPSYWAHEDLDPYFPCRPRSRDEMRIQAKAGPR